MKRKRKIVIGIVFFSLFLCNLNHQIYAEETVKITATQVSGKPGDTVAVTFSVTDNPGTTIYEMNIGYDTDALEVVSVEDGKYYPEWFEADISIEPLYISAGDALSLNNLSDDCQLATVYFKISEQAEEGDYYFTVSNGLFLNGELKEYQVDYDNSGCIIVKNNAQAQNEKTDTEKEESDKTAIALCIIAGVIIAGVVVVRYRKRRGDFL